MVESNDLDLILKFKRGDPSVFGELVLKYQDRIYNSCFYMLGNHQDAEDAAQETFIKAFRNMASFKTEAPFYTWLYRIGINTCLDHQKKSSSHHKSSHVDIDSLSQEIPSAASTEKQYQAIELTEALQSALGKMPAKLKAILVLKEVDDLSYEEISKVLNISMGTVKSRISRARELLRKILRNKI
jgi:RNA polymerase sigma-70 factor, ECF subfamily